MTKMRFCEVFTEEHLQALCDLCVCVITLQCAKLNLLFVGKLNIS